MKVEVGIIVALDGMTAQEATDTAQKLSNNDVTVKVNDVLYDHGWEILNDLSSCGVDVFADAKIKDIPWTAANITKKLVQGNPKFITLHATGGTKMMEFVVEKRKQSNILAVTELTSIEFEFLQKIYRTPLNMGKIVFNLALDALNAGVQGIVCSGQELKYLDRFRELDSLIKVVPGIRPQWYQDTHPEPDDQKRLMTAGEAAAKGADYLVMGRPILRAGIPPSDALQKTREEIAIALE